MTQDKDLQEQIKKKLKNGWIKSSMMIEVLAVNPNAAKEALEKHVEKICKEDKVFVYKKDFQQIIETKSPFPQIPKAYSGLVEIELMTQNFDKLVYVVMNYGPTNVEILEPSKLNISMGEAQGIITSIATMLHKFAAAGLGGVMINA